jgi:uncharacterized membrane protein
VTTGDAGRSSTGLDPTLAGALAYLLGFVTGILLLVVEKDSPFVRFHAAQSTIFFIAVLVLNFLIVAMPLGWILVPPFFIALFAMWVLLMLRALRGRRYKLPYIGDFAEEISR